MQTLAVHIGSLGTHKLWMSSVDAKKRESLKELSQSDGYHKEFYVRATVRAARTRATHLLLRMSPGHSRCALTASPAQHGSTHRYPRYCTAMWRVVQSHYI